MYGPVAWSKFPRFGVAACPYEPGDADVLLAGWRPLRRWPACPQPAPQNIAVTRLQTGEPGSGEFAPCRSGPPRSLPCTAYCALRGNVKRSRPKLRATFCLLGLTALAACGQQGPDHNVEATYNKETGKLSQLTVDARKDGNPNITSYMDGSNFLHIEIDRDEDGKVDRWEYYGADQKLEKVGFSRANDGKPDAWAFEGAAGGLGKMQVSTKRDGKPNRTEFYQKGELIRAEEDTDGDGRTDKWETYSGGALVTVSFDMTKSGTPNKTIDYRK